MYMCLAYDRTCKAWCRSRCINTSIACVIHLSMRVLRGCLFHILLIIRRVMRLLFMVFPKVIVADSKEM